MLRFHPWIIFSVGVRQAHPVFAVAIVKIIDRDLCRPAFEVIVDAAEIAVVHPGPINSSLPDLDELIAGDADVPLARGLDGLLGGEAHHDAPRVGETVFRAADNPLIPQAPDRKSTRLNSSH